MSYAPRGWPAARTSAEPDSATTAAAAALSRFLITLLFSQGGSCRKGRSVRSRLYAQLYGAIPLQPGHSGRFSHLQTMSTAAARFRTIPKKPKLLQRTLQRRISGDNTRACTRGSDLQTDGSCRQQESSLVPLAGENVLNYRFNDSTRHMPTGGLCG
jgi:hypothetical protein